MSYHSQKVSLISHPPYCCAFEDVKTSPVEVRHSVTVMYSVEKETEQVKIILFPLKNYLSLIL